METAGFPEKLVTIYQTIQSHPEDHNLNNTELVTPKAHQFKLRLFCFGGA
jgi:hypothetical protein